MAKLGVPLHITERIIDHRGTVSGVAAVYNRYQFLDEMKEALLQYEDHIATLVKLWAEMHRAVATAPFIKEPSYENVKQEAITRQNLAFNSVHYTFGERGKVSSTS